jgi:hypothetical protein
MNESDIPLAWLEAANAWTAEALAAQGIQTLGRLEPVRLMPWSKVFRIATDGGDVYFKATTPALGHEPALTIALNQWRPDCVPRLLAADVGRRWLLLADSGVMLRTLFAAGESMARWQDVVPLYAGLQASVADHASDMLAFGVLDRRLSVLPGQYERLLSDEAAVRVGQPNGLTVEEYGRLRDLTPYLATLCQQLAAYGIPETLEHNDFHDGNIFVQDGRYRFADWGDSCITHPFVTLLTIRRSLENRFDLAEDAPEMLALRDLYLASWQEYGSLDELRQASELAYHIGAVIRALTWQQAMSDGPIPADFAHAIPAWLQEFAASAG